MRTQRRSLFQIFPPFSLCCAYLLIILSFLGLASTTAFGQYTDPLDVDSDGVVPIDFEPLSGFIPISSLDFDIDGDGSLETLTFSTTSSSGDAATVSLGSIPSAFPTPTNTLSSKPNFGKSLPLTISFSEPMVTFSFALIDPQYITPQVMASLTGLDLNTSSLGEIIEAMDAQNDPRGTIVRAFDASGTPVGVNFCIEDLDPARPIGGNPILSQLTDLSAQGGPVSALSIPGDGNTAGFTSDLSLTVLKVTIAAPTSPFSSISIEAAVPGSTGVPLSGDFIALDDLDGTIGENSDLDNDGIADCFDNCPSTSNPNQADADCDGVGDLCDQWPGCDDNSDSDNDGTPDCIDLDELALWACGQNGAKVSLCHVLPGNPNNRRTICVSPNAVDSHLAHGDYIGDCGQVACSENLSAPSGSTIIAGAEKSPTDDFLLYPNPASGDITLGLSFYLGQSVSIAIHDQLGRRILSVPRQELNSPLLRLNLAERQLPNGVYLLSVETPEGRKVKQFVLMD